ncbi:Tab2/Atab2 family RNA-binding protein [Rivularia sp. UHCC 0363]|nr:Tab2/Atab2 family RNA-binding protein [Rivularia sp. UHCC 0363]MEA5597344.1 Tab2/Atab2 family RNA-binding protein [Rivularia sp. UHCC 0363]
MKIWQVDFYRRPLQDAEGHPVWELVACEPDDSPAFAAQAYCPQSEVSADWLTQALQVFAAEAGGLPQQIQIFRPQCLSLLETACLPLQITVEPNRDLPELKQILQERAAQYPALPNYSLPPLGQPYSPTALDQPPPLPLPENLWGERWQFAALPASELIPAFQNRPIPVLEMPASRSPLALKLPSDLPIPGVIIEAGRRAMTLTRWLQQTKPYALSAMAGEPDGLILEAGLVDRWVLTTFSDPEVSDAGRSFQSRQQAALGLHFLLVQPDDSGMTYSGFWLLRAEPT